MSENKKPMKLKDLLKEGTSINHKDILKQIDKYIESLEDENPVNYYREVTDFIALLYRKINVLTKILENT